jgi:hypothetical protein
MSLFFKLIVKQALKFKTFLDHFYFINNSDYMVISLRSYLKEKEESWFSQPTTTQ